MSGVPVFVELVFFNEVTEGGNSRRDFNIMLLAWQLRFDIVDAVRVTGSVTLQRLQKKQKKAGE